MAYKKRKKKCKICKKQFMGTPRRLTCSKECNLIKKLEQILLEERITIIENAEKCEKLWDINNGITLCRDCHKLTDNYGNKKRLYKQWRDNAPICGEEFE